MHIYIYNHIYIYIHVYTCAQSIEYVYDNIHMCMCVCVPIIYFVLPFVLRIGWLLRKRLSNLPMGAARLSTQGPDTFASKSG